MPSRTTSFAGNPKAITAGSAQTVIWSSSEIDSTGVTGFGIVLYGNGAATWQQVTFVDRVRVRAAGRLIVDLPLAQLQAFQAAYFNSNYYDNQGAAANGALYIPLNMPDGPTQETQDQCQFPAGAEAQVELITNTTAVAGGAYLFWNQSNQTPRFFPRMLSSAANWSAALARNQRYNFSDDGFVRAVGFTLAGIDRAECYISGQRAFNIGGAAYGNGATAPATPADMSVERDVPEQGAAIGTYRWRQTEMLLPAASGSSYLSVDTTAAYVGAAGEVGIYSIVPQERFRASS